MTKELFDNDGYVQIDGFLDPAMVQIMSQYFENKLRRGDWVEGRERVQQASKLFCYADPLTEAVLLAALPEIERICGQDLLPTYSYSRIYQPGDELKPHVDRPSCEVSVTVNIANKGEVSPIYIEYGSNKPAVCTLNPGDAVVYKGCKASHWRNPTLEGQLTVQFMLHYVNKNGPNALFHKDKRRAFGIGKTGV
jgi:hypothetical protein